MVDESVALHSCALRVRTRPCCALARVDPPVRAHPRDSDPALVFAQDEEKLGKGLACALLLVGVSLILRKRVARSKRGGGASRRAQPLHGRRGDRAHRHAHHRRADLAAARSLGARRLALVPTPEAARAALPWYAPPWFWGTGALRLVFLFAANTTIGGLVPGLKKPMDFVEEHENKLSALIATPVVLLEVKRLLGFAAPCALRGPGPSCHRRGSPSSRGPRVRGRLQSGGPGVRRLGLAILYAACFFVVFLAFHSIQVLIALSPSMLLDLLLRIFRALDAGLLGLSSWIHPYLGAALGFGILFVALLIAGWSFRLTVYGSVFSWDFLDRQGRHGRPGDAPLVAFSQKGLAGVPPRSLGRLERTGAAVDLPLAPLADPAARRIALPAGETAVLRGAISPLLVRQAALRAQTLVRFPPRFRDREAALAKRLGVGEVLEAGSCAASRPPGVAQGAAAGIAREAFPGPPLPRPPPSPGRRRGRRRAPRAARARSRRSGRRSPRSPSARGSRSRRRGRAPAGIAAIIVAIEVIRIGRSRTGPARSIASQRVSALARAAGWRSRPG